jgi:hypothetical protein
MSVLDDEVEAVSFPSRICSRNSRVSGEVDAQFVGKHAAAVRIASVRRSSVHLRSMLIILR